MRIKREVIQMTINDNCGACGQCYEACSYDAIKINKTSGYSDFYIDVSKCANCGACKNICPMEAINAD